MQHLTDRARNLQLMILISIIVILFYLLNQIIPTFADDLCRSSSVFNLAEIFADIYAKYFNWTGRSFVMLLNRLTFSSGEFGLGMFNLINSLMLGISCWFAVHWATLNSTKPNTISLTLALSASVLVIYLFLLWFTPDVFAEVLLWKTGAIQYFWACVIVLYVLRPVIELFLDNCNNRDQSLTANNNKFSHWSSASVYCAIAFLGGNWLEHVSISVIPVWIILLIASAPSRQLWRQRIPSVLVLGLIAWCLGALLLFAAPGNYEKAGSIGESLTILERLIHVLRECYEFLDKTTLLFFGLFLFMLLINRPADTTRRLTQSSIFLLLAILPTLAMIGAPSTSFVRRTAFPYEFFLIFAVLSIFPTYLFTNGTTRFLQYQRQVLALISLILFYSILSDTRIVYRNYLSIWQQTQVREQWITAAREIKLPLVLFTPLYFDADTGLETVSTATGQINQGRYFARDITRNPKHWKNTCFAKAYELQAVVLK